MTATSCHSAVLAIWAGRAEPFALEAPGAGSGHATQPDIDAWYVARLGAIDVVMDDELIAALAAGGDTALREPHGIDDQLVPGDPGPAPPAAASP